MPALKTYDLFISHAWKYNNEYYRLEKLLDEYNYFNYRNYSVPEDDPLDFKNTKDLTDKIDEQIRQSSVVLLIGGMYINYRKWIQAEIKIAQKYGKPIILVRPYGASKIPTIAEKSADRIVFWNTASIVSAIRELSI